MLGDVEVDDASPMVGEDDEDEQDLEARGGHGEEVDGDQVPEVVGRGTCARSATAVRRFGISRETVRSAISMPSFWSSRVSRVTLTCSAGGSPAGARASSPVAWMAG